MYDETLHCDYNGQLAARGMVMRGDQHALSVDTCVDMDASVPTVSSYSNMPFTGPQRHAVSNAVL